MLITACSMKEFSFSGLMEVYREGNLENGRQRRPDASEDRQLQIAEDDFYEYLHDDFFRNKGARYFILQTEAGNYVSALRVEPYRDGLLLEALETATNERRRGYAKKLVGQTLEAISREGAGVIYSHVSKRNRASLAVHIQCGFSVYLDYALYIDGSINDRAYTLRYRF